MRARPPLALMVGLALTVVVRLWAIARELLLVHYGDDLAGYAHLVVRVEPICRGVEWSAVVLLAAGWAELARRTHGRSRAVLSLVVVASGCAAAGLVASDLVPVLVGSIEGFRLWFERIALASGAIYIAQAVLVVIGTAAHRWAAAVVVGAAVVTQVVIVAATGGTPLFVDHGIATAVGLALLHAGYLVGVYAIAARFADAHPPAAGSLAEARAGFALGGAAMWLRLVIAVALLQYVRATREWAWAPVLIAVHGLTLLAFAWGVLRAARDPVPGRVRLVLAGGLCAWWAGVQSEAALVTQLLGDAISPEPLAIAGPIVGLAAMVLVVSAAMSIASVRGDLELRASLLWFGTAMTGCELASLWLGTRFDAKPAQLVVGSLIGLVGIGCIGYACHATAKALAREHPVPPARVVS